VWTLRFATFAINLVGSLAMLGMTSSPYGWAIDCRVQQTPENFLGVRYKARLVRDDLS